MKVHRMITVRDFAGKVLTSAEQTLDLDQALADIDVPRAREQLLAGEPVMQTRSSFGVLITAKLVPAHAINRTGQLRSQSSVLSPHHSKDLRGGTRLDILA